MNPSGLEVAGAGLFAVAVLHTFCVGLFARRAQAYPADSVRHAIFHLLGEVEIVFGFWAFVLFLGLAAVTGFSAVVDYQSRFHLVEPLFVFCIMTVASTRPVLQFSEQLIQKASLLFEKVIPVQRSIRDLFLLLTLGPLLGSFITEPAAMTVSAMLASRLLHRHDEKLLYGMLALLFVNVSIGGALTSFAAPPIIMVAGPWGWTSTTVFGLFGWKAFTAVFLNTLVWMVIFRKKLVTHFYSLDQIQNPDRQVPISIVFLHVLFLALLVLVSHYANLLAGVFLLFLGITVVTKKFQDPLRLRESLLVAFFLGGIVVFGPLQAWWLSPVLKSLGSFTLYIAATALTSVTDNAALTFLGTQVPGLSEQAQYFLVAGALAGGGLTIIANAPNAAGYSALQKHFKDGLHAGRLFRAALLPTLIAFLALGLL